MKALRRSHTATAASSSTSTATEPSSSTISSSPPVSSWIPLRYLLIIASSTHDSDRGSLKSPWSRRKRKHALSQNQWKNLFTPDGKFMDGGVKFLKKVRSGGVDPRIREEAKTVTLVGSNLVIFGGEDAKRTLLNDLHILNLESMTWDEIDAVGVSPSPRSDHSAAVHAERYLLIFGGGSHSTCFNDLHVLDLQSMEWSRPIQQGVVPSPRAGHAGITVGENWFIVGGGDNKNGASETLVLNMSTLVWSVVQGCFH